MDIVVNRYKSMVMGVLHCKCHDYHNDFMIDIQLVVCIMGSIPCICISSAIDSVLSYIHSRCMVTVSLHNTTRFTDFSIDTGREFSLYYSTHIESS